MTSNNRKENQPQVSSAVIRRLPRYYRYLRELVRNGQSRISSGELSKMMHVTASQIRQDLNCFGGFGQQGYGYNVNYLFAKISELLGVGEGYCGIIIGAGNLGHALVRNRMFERRGVDIVAMFDIDDKIIGKDYGDVKVYKMDDLEAFCASNKVDIAVMTLPKDAADDAVKRLEALGIKGLWNFTGIELKVKDGTVCENVHLGDSLMTLCYELRSNGICSEAKGKED